MRIDYYFMEDFQIKMGMVVGKGQLPHNFGCLVTKVLLLACRLEIRIVV